jgi:ABC-type branched-subunit amino acid transport system ATPase component
MEIEGLRKTFGGITALRSFDLSVHAGEVCAIMGPNGSGKTVLFNLISGFLKPDSGNIYYGADRVELTGMTPSGRHSLGIVRTFQHINLFQSLSVLENVIVGMGPDSIFTYMKDIFFGSNRKIHDKKKREKASHVLSFFGDRLLPRAEEPSLSLSYANRRRLEFARALGGNPILILLDEPTAGMNPYETYQLQEIVSNLRNEGFTFLIIEHKMFFFEDLADNIVVLAQGEKICEGSIFEIRNDKRVIEAYLGDNDVVID